MAGSYLGSVAGGFIVGGVIVALIGSASLRSREDEMREYYLAELKRACDNAVKQTEEEMRMREARKPDVITVDAVSVLPRAIIEDPHFQNRLKQAGKDFSSDYAKGIGL
jgi:hypothetical protein